MIDNNGSLGIRIKMLRIKAGYSQETLATLIRVDQTAISHYERDGREPPLDTLIRIAAIFKVSTDYLLGIEKKVTLKTDGLTITEIQGVQNIIDLILNAKTNHDRQ